MDNTFSIHFLRKFSFIFLFFSNKRKFCFASSLFLYLPFPLPQTLCNSTSGWEILWCTLRERLGTGCDSQKILIFFLLKFNMICTFWIVLMWWCQKWFLKIKNIIGMYFGAKSYLKSTRNHTVKHALSNQSMLFY
jgi:hypothetical protein